MAEKFKTDIDLEYNSIVKGGFEPLPSLPTENNSLGRQVFKDKPHWWNGTEWISWENIDSNAFWQTDKANAEAPAYWYIKDDNFKGAFPFFLEKTNNNYLASRTIFLNTANLYNDVQDFLGIKGWSDINAIPKNIRYEIIFCDLGLWQKPRYFYLPVLSYMCTNITTIVYPDFAPDKRYYQILYTGSLKCSVISCPQGVFVNVSSSPQCSLPASQGTLSESATLIKDFCTQENIPYSTFASLNTDYFNAVDVLACLIEKLNQGGGGATDTFWSLSTANAEVNGCIIPIVSDNDSVFDKMLEIYGSYSYSRSIVVDLSGYQGEYQNIIDIFGDITNVPIGVRYSIYMSGIDTSIKVDFPLSYNTNWNLTHVNFERESWTVSYNKALKFDFIKLADNKVWVDVSQKLT